MTFSQKRFVSIDIQWSNLTCEFDIKCNYFDGATLVPTHQGRA